MSVAVLLSSLLRPPVPLMACARVKASLRLNSSVALLTTAPVPSVPEVPALPTRSVPPLMVVPPLKVLPPAKVTLPSLAATVSEPLPEMTPLNTGLIALKVSVPLLVNLCQAYPEAPPEPVPAVPPVAAVAPRYLAMTMPEPPAPPP